MNELYVYASSSDCKELYPTNKVNNFRVNLGENIVTDEGWYVGLVSVKTPCINVKGRSEYISICSPMVIPSMEGGTKVPILGKVLVSGKEDLHQFQHVAYVPVRSRDLSTIQIYMKREGDRETPAFKTDTSVECTLHFKRRQS